MIQRMAQQTLDENCATLEKLEKFATSREHAIALAVGWLASQPQVSSVISGATSPSRSPKT